MVMVIWVPVATYVPSVDGAVIRSIRVSEKNSAPHVVAVAAQLVEVVDNKNCVPVATSTLPQSIAAGNANPEGHVSSTRSDASTDISTVNTTVWFALTPSRESDSVSARS